MNFLAAFAFFQFVLYLLFFQSHGVKFRVYVYNFVEDQRDIGIRWPDEEQVLIEHGGRKKFHFELRKTEQLILEPKMQFDLEKKDAVEEEFIAFTYTDLPSKMIIIDDDDTLEIYYAVKKNGMYLWDYNSHISYIIESKRHRIIPKDEHLYIKKQWQTMKD